MQDSIYLLVDGKLVENFLSYTVDADIFKCDGAFCLELANPEIRITNGLPCELWINDALELTGVIKHIEKSYTKAGRKLTIQGQDFMGLLTEAYCEEFFTIQNMKLKDLAERLLRKVPYINREKIIYQQNLTGGLKNKKKAKTDISGLTASTMAFSQVEPGMTVFEVLKEYARSRGLIFWGMPDGTFIFGRPMTGGRPFFSLINKIKDSKQNNVLEGTEIDDISGRYRTVTIVGQQQGQSSDAVTAAGAQKINTKDTATDPTFPYYKPFVGTDNNDSASPALHSRLLMEKMKHDGYSLEYTTPGHGQNGANWAINQFKTVNEGPIKVVSAYGRIGELIEGREYMQHYGFTSRPLPGAEGIYASKDNHYILIASDDRRYRIAVASGEVCIYTDEGDFAHFKRDKNIHVFTGNKLLVDATNDVEINTTRAVLNASESATVNTPRAIVNASESAIVTTPLFQVNSAEINLATDREDLRRIIDERFRELFNTHTHSNCGGDQNSGYPNQSLELDDVATSITRAL